MIYSELSLDEEYSIEREKRLQRLVIKLFEVADIESPGYSETDNCAYVTRDVIRCEAFLLTMEKGAHAQFLSGGLRSLADKIDAFTEDK